MTTTNSILDDGQRSLLTAALNRIVPPHGEMPGAGDVGVAGFVESVASASASRRRQLIDGLAQITIAASERGGAFADLAHAAQTEVLKSVEEAEPVFFAELVTQTYRGYYTDETVCALLSYRAPNREDYDPVPFDESLLDPVRQRGQIWTSTD